VQDLFTMLSPSLFAVKLVLLAFRACLCPFFCLALGFERLMYILQAIRRHFNDACCLYSDWSKSIARAREIAGPKLVLVGNVDPKVSYSSEANICAAAAHCIAQAGCKHVLNLGHGVEKDTPEAAVAAFVDVAK
jgi:uroporphyrinogen-III decarboxylase